MREDKQPPRSFTGAATTVRNAALVALMAQLPVSIPTVAECEPWRAAACALVWTAAADLWFGALHWSMHSKRLYWAHAAHHTDTSPSTTTDVLKCSVVELFAVNGAAVVAGPCLLPCTPWVTQAWVAFATTNAALAHSSLRGSRRHSLHHATRTCNFGTGLFVFDRLAGTLR